MTRGSARPCRPEGPLRGGPPHLTGMVPHNEMERRMARSLGDRCHMLWLALYGGDCDFDDLSVALAQMLGWVVPPDADLSEILSGSAHTINECDLPWTTLRGMAIAVFETVRHDAGREVADFDPRTWEEAVDDALFATGACRACTLGVPGTSAQHRSLAGWVLHRRTSWAQVESAMTAR